VVSSTPWPLYPQGKSAWYPLNRRLGGPQSRSERCGEEKISSPRRLFERLIVTQLAKKYLFFMESEGSLRVHKIPPLDPILRQPNPVRPIDPYFAKVHLNVILTTDIWKLKKERL
jgi:hypothetical protein